MQKLLNALIFNALILFQFLPAHADESFLPSLNGCECKTIKVECSDEKMRTTCAAHADACAKGCTMTMTTASCAALGMESGAIPYQQIFENRRCGKGDIERIAAEGDEKKLSKLIISCTSLLHETVHMCLGQLAQANRQVACEEWSAKKSEFHVLDRALKLLCAKEAETMQGTTMSLRCSNLCMHSFNQDVIAGWLHCMCKATDSAEGFLGLSDWLTKKECCSCRARCLERKLDSGKPWLPAYCKKVLGDPKIEKMIGDQLTNACNTLSFDPGHYSCGTMSKNGEAQFGESCP